MRKKVILVIIALFILVGIIVVCCVGFNKGNSYGSSIKINIYMTESFEMDDVKEIANEVFEGTSYTIDYIDDFESSVTISVKTITDEQKTNLTDKLSEKYELSEDDRRYSLYKYSCCVNI